MIKKKNSLRNISSSFYFFQKIIKKSGFAASTSYTLLGSILLGILIGWYCDYLYLSSPMGLLIGVFTGLIIGFYNLAKSLWYKKLK